MRRWWKGFGVRVAYHGRNLLFGSGRVRYIRSKSRTLRSRIRSRIRQMIYSSFRSDSKPIPRALQNVREANYVAKRKYVPGPYRGKVTLFRAAVRWPVDSPGLDMGWERLALGGVEIREVPGDHVNMLLRPQVGLLAEQLRECIDKAAGAEIPTSEQESTSGSVPG
jgi:hypothetical protein